MDFLPPDRAAAWRKRWAGETEATERGTRATTVYTNVVCLLRREKPGTEIGAPRIKEALREQGIPFDQKQLYNVLDYLRRKGRLTRVSHGRYLVDGLIGFTDPNEP